MSIGITRPDGALRFNEKLLTEPQRYAMRQTGVMGPFDVFGNVLLCTPKDSADRVWQRISANVDMINGLAFGASRLPNDAGLLFKVLGRETVSVKAKVREFLGRGSRRSDWCRPAATVPVAVIGELPAKSSDERPLWRTVACIGGGVVPLSRARWGGS